MILEMMAIPVAQDHSDVAEEGGSNLRIENTIDLITHFDTQLPYSGTIYSHTKSSQPDWYFTARTLMLSSMPWNSAFKIGTQQRERLN